MAISRDSKHIVSGSVNGLIKIWEINSGTCLRTLNDKGGEQVTEL